MLKDETIIEELIKFYKAKYILYILFFENRVKKKNFKVKSC